MQSVALQHCERDNEAKIENKRCIICVYIEKGVLLCFSDVRFLTLTTFVYLSTWRNNENYLINRILPLLHCRNLSNIRIQYAPSANQSQKGRFYYLLIEIIQEGSNTFKSLFRLVFNLDCKFDFCLSHPTQVSQRLQVCHQTDALS